MQKLRPFQHPPCDVLTMLASSAPSLHDWRLPATQDSTRQGLPQDRPLLYYHLVNYGAIRSRSDSMMMFKTPRTHLKDRDFPIRIHFWV